MTGFAPRVDAIRREAGFLTVPALMEGIGRGNLVLDPFSVLVSLNVRVGTGNVFYPSTVIEARDGGVIAIGDSNEFGPGSATLRAIGAGEAIHVGNGGRFLHGCLIQGRTMLGDGAQVLGPIDVRRCALEAGDTWRDPDPDARGGVLKGSGRAEGLRVARGHVIQAWGDFAGAPVRRQAQFHPAGT